MITGTKSKDPDDCRGGILADDMGLGKTLTALSAVVASLEKAAKYAAEWRQGGQRPGTSSSWTTSLATVVVVPSERMSYDVLAPLDEADIMAVLLNTWAREIDQWVIHSREQTAELS